MINRHALNLVSITYSGVENLSHAIMFIPNAIWINIYYSYLK